jgi:transcriptional regulator with XRE-family HTH domain
VRSDPDRRGSTLYGCASAQGQSERGARTANQRASSDDTPDVSRRARGDQVTKEKQGNKVPEALVIGENLRRIRIAMGITQSDLGERVGLGQGGISAIERGVRCPSIPALFELARACGIPPGRLVELAPPEPETLKVEENCMKDLLDAMRALGVRNRVVVISMAGNSPSVFVDEAASDGYRPRENHPCVALTAADLVHLAALVARPPVELSV